MWHSHIPKLKIAFPSDVLVSSHYRPNRNLTFYNVLACHGSSFCNSVCLNFQAFAVRDLNGCLRRLSHGSKKEKQQRPNCWRRCIYICHLSYLLFATLFIEWLQVLGLIIWQVKNQYFLTFITLLPHLMTWPQVLRSSHQ